MQMTPEQFGQLLRFLEKIADRQFTITQATDWPMLYVFMGMFIIIVGLFWRDLGRRFDLLSCALKDFKADDNKAHDSIWQAMSDCQADCCPRGNFRRPQKEGGANDHPS